MSAFNCPKCDRRVPYQFQSQAQVKCTCGQKFTKTVTVTIREDNS